MKLSFIVTLSILLTYNSYSQGCSDAGGCSAGHIGMMSTEDQHPAFFISYSQTLGLADKEAIVSNSQIALTHFMGKNTSIELKIPYMMTYGNLGFTSGVGDIITSVSQQLFTHNNFSFTLIAGTRLKSNNADAMLNEIPLPMVYQSSLGTNDIIGGINMLYKKWSFSTAYQHPFGRNQNGYVLNDVENIPKREQYNESANLKRGDDLILRIQRTLNLKVGSKLTLGAIPIYRLQESEIKKEDRYIQLEGSDGLTMNVFFSWNKEIDQTRNFSLTGGFPVIDREYRSDGLTRTFTLMAQLSWKLKKIKKEAKPIKGLYDSIKLDD